MSLVMMQCGVEIQTQYLNLDYIFTQISKYSSGTAKNIFNFSHKLGWKGLIVAKPKNTYINLKVLYLMFQISPI